MTTPLEALAEALRDCRRYATEAEASAGGNPMVRSW